MTAEPVLRYEPPANFRRTGLVHLDDYASTEFNASLQVYSFRRCEGDPASLFRATLLRDWIDPSFREANAVNLSFGTFPVPGASAVHTVQFFESTGALPRHRQRVIVVAAASLAIVDAHSAAHIWATVVQSFDGLLKSLRVET